MIDLIEECSLHPSRADEHLKFLQECLEEYKNSFQQALKSLQMQTNNIESITKQIKTIELWKKEQCQSQNLKDKPLTQDCGCPYTR